MHVQVLGIYVIVGNVALINWTCLSIIGSGDSDEEQRQAKRVAMRQRQVVTKAPPKAKSLPAPTKERDPRVS